MAYQMAAKIMTLNDLERNLSVAGLFKCNPSNICAACYTISTDSVLARLLCISRASYLNKHNLLCHWAPSAVAFKINCKLLVQEESVILASVNMLILYMNSWMFCRLSQICTACIWIQRFGNNPNSSDQKDFSMSLVTLLARNSLCLSL